MTLGGLLKHLALVEDWWFSVVLLGNEDAEPWRAGRLGRRPRLGVAHRRRRQPGGAAPAVRRGGRASQTGNIRQVLADGGLDALVGPRDASTTRRAFSLRWILLHMIEEYARHNGHADLIRESIDGQTGE